MSFRFHRASSFNFSQYRGNGGGRVLQRRCACGNRAESGGECSQCAESERSLQRKARSGGPFEAPPIVDDVLRSPGQPLDRESRGFMEERFGYDFSSVRVHADEQAQRSADETNADAYTVGQDIVFASGRYAPRTPAGQQLLAHELTHVVQQRSAPSSGPIEMGERDEYEVNADQTASQVVSGSGPVPAVSSTGVSLQRQEAKEAGAESKTAAAPCLEHVVGEDIGALMESGALTIIEFGATWCTPCKQLKEDLNSICEGFRKQPPPVTVRFYSIDIDVEGNEKVSEPFVPGGGVPHLYFFVGSSQQSHYDSAPQVDVLEKIVADHVEYASTSGAARGAFKGMGWGSLAGGLAGLAGGIGLGAHLKLEGNEMMGAALGGGAIGAALGLGLGAAFGAIAGHVSDDRNTGPKKQKRRKLQKQSRDNQSHDEQKRKKQDVQTSSPQKKSEDVSLPWSRGEKTAASTGIGAAGGALVGLGLGLGIAATMKDTPYGAGAGWGALIGGVAGALGGLLYGLLSPGNTEQESQEVADAVIRRRYGKYLRNAGAGPFHNAKVNTVTRAEICERKACRTCVPSPAVDCTQPGSPKDCVPKPAEDCTKPAFNSDCGLIGWADSGPPIKPSLGPKGAQPAPLAAEPTCNGRQMDHATNSRPVIYYAKDAPAGTMIHEGLHAWSHPDFAFLHNHVNEGATEYFTRRLSDDINMPHYGSYEDEYKNVQKLVGLVGEEKLARAYFGGQVAELHQAVNSQLGDCALITWAFALQQFSFGWADQIMEERNQNYCGAKRFRGFTPGELTPPPPTQEQTNQHKATEQR